MEIFLKLGRFKKECVKIQRSMAHLLPPFVDAHDYNIEINLSTLIAANIQRRSWKTLIKMKIKRKVVKSFVIKSGIRVIKNSWLDVRPNKIFQIS